MDLRSNLVEWQDVIGRFAASSKPGTAGGCIALARENDGVFGSRAMPFATFMLRRARLGATNLIGPDGRCCCMPSTAVSPCMVDLLDPADKACSS